MDVLGVMTPRPRLEDMKIDGTEAEVLYPSYALTLYRLTDPPFQRALFSVYNDWLAEFCSHAPGVASGYRTDLDV